MTDLDALWGEVWPKLTAVESHQMREGIDALNQRLLEAERQVVFWHERYRFEVTASRESEGRKLVAEARIAQLEWAAKRALNLLEAEGDADAWLDFVGEEGADTDWTAVVKGLRAALALDEKP